MQLLMWVTLMLNLILQDRHQFHSRNRTIARRCCCLHSTPYITATRPSGVRPRGARGRILAAVFYIHTVHAGTLMSSQISHRGRGRMSPKGLVLLFFFFSFLSVSVGRLSQLGFLFFSPLSVRALWCGHTALVHKAPHYGLFLISRKDFFPTAMEMAPISFRTESRSLSFFDMRHFCIERSP
jgi:hypothetical protein